MVSSSTPLGTGQVRMDSVKCIRLPYVALPGVTHNRGMGHRCKLFIAEQGLESTGSAPGRLSILCSTVGPVGEETWFRNGEASREDETFELNLTAMVDQGGGGLGAQRTT